MISAQSNKVIQEKLITKFMSIPNMLVSVYIKRIIIVSITDIHDM